MVGVIKRSARGVVGSDLYDKVARLYGHLRKKLNANRLAIKRILTYPNIQWIAYLSGKHRIVLDDIRYAPYLYGGLKAMANMSNKPVVHIAYGVIGQDHEAVNRLIGLKEIEFVIHAMGNSTKVQLSADVFNRDGSIREGIQIVPFPMHARHYELGSISNKDAVAENENRKFRIFFSGNSHKESYDNVIIKEGFRLLSRNEILTRVKKILGNDRRVYLALNKTEIENLERSSQLVVAILDFSWSFQERGPLQNRIDWDDWFSFLGDSDFFLGCPGIRMPFSHNIVEAMHVGAIPILEFPYLFRPPLEDGVHCLCFGKGKRTLEDAIDLAIQMDAQQIHTMRENVLRYKDMHLSQAVFWRSLLEQNENITMHLPVTGISELNVQQSVRTG